jgi:hypothetical protein
MVIVEMTVTEAFTEAPIAFATTADPCSCGARRAVWIS